MKKTLKPRYLLPLLNCKIIWKSEKPAGAPTISHVMNTMLKSKRGGFIFYSRGQNIHKGGHIVGRLSNDDDNGDIYIVLKREIEALQPSQPFLRTSMTIIIIITLLSGKPTSILRIKLLPKTSQPLDIYSTLGGSQKHFLGNIKQYRKYLMSFASVLCRIILCVVLCQENYRQHCQFSTFSGRLPERN